MYVAQTVIDVATRGLAKYLCVRGPLPYSDLSEICQANNELPLHVFKLTAELFSFAFISKPSEIPIQRPCYFALNFSHANAHHSAQFGILPNCKIAIV